MDGRLSCTICSISQPRSLDGREKEKSRKVPPTAIKFGYLSRAVFMKDSVGNVGCWTCISIDAWVWMYWGPFHVRPSSICLDSHNHDDVHWVVVRLSHRYKLIFSTFESGILKNSLV